MSGQRHQSAWSKEIQEVSSPRVLDHETQIVLPHEFDGFLDVVWRSGIDADYGYAPLLTRDPKRSVEVAGLDSAVRECVRLPVGVLGSTRLVRTPDAVVPAGEDISAIARSRVVAWSGRWGRVEEGLR